MLCWILFSTGYIKFHIKIINRLKAHKSELYFQLNAICFTKNVHVLWNLYLDNMFEEDKLYHKTSNAMILEIIRF